MEASVQDNNTNENSNAEPKKIGTPLKITLIIAAAVIAALVIGEIVLRVNFKDKWYPSSTVNGISIGSKSLEETVDILSMSDYTLTLNARGGVSEVISGQDVGASTDIESPLRDEFAAQHSGLAIISYFGAHNIEIYETITYSEDALTNAINSLYILTGNESYTITPPVDASVGFDAEYHKAVATAESEGNMIDPIALGAAVRQAIVSRESVLELDGNSDYPNIYYSPSVRIGDEALETLVNEYNNYILHWIVWDFGNGQTRQITPDDIWSWTYLTSDGSVAVNQTSLASWIENMCLEIKTVGRTRSFTTHSGNVIEISGGDYGWQMDYSQTLQQAQEAISVSDQQLVDNYVKENSVPNLQALTTTYSPIYKRTAKTQNFSDLSDDWDHQNYSEISLSEQMVWVYKDGECVLNIPCITGKPVEGRATPTGVYYVKERKRDKVLVGEDYETPVTYWVRITWSGVGYHDAEWQDWSSWSPTRYYSVGSHGCVNLSMSNAEKIYDIVRVNDPVFIY